MKRVIFLLFLLPLVLLLSGCVSMEETYQDSSQESTQTHEQTIEKEIDALPCTNVSNVEKCFYEKAITETNITYCELSGAYIDACFNEYYYKQALVSKDIHYCEFINDSVKSYSLGNHTGIGGGSYCCSYMNMYTSEDLNCSSHTSIKYPINHYLNLTQFYEDINVEWKSFKLYICSVDLTNGTRMSFEKTILKDSCKYVLSILTSNLSTCLEVQNCNGTCYLRFAAKESNLSYCDLLHNITHDSCMYDTISTDWGTCAFLVARKTGNISLCPQIIPYGYQNCENQILQTIRITDSEICEEAVYTDLCYYNLAISYNDTTLCEKAGKFKINCIEELQ